MKILSKMAGGLLLAIIIAGSGSAQFNQAVWDTLTNDNVQNRLTPQAIGVNGYEQFHLTYTRTRPAGGNIICYRFFDMLAGLSPEIIAESSMACYNPVIASAFGDNISDVVIAYEADGDIWGCVNSIPPGPWDFINISNSADPDMSPTLDYGSSEPQGAWITYTNSQYKIRYVRGDGDSLIYETIQQSELGEFGAGAQPFIVVFDNLPHIFYRGVNGGSYHIHHAYKTQLDGAWIIDHLQTPNLEDFTATAVANIIGDIDLAISGNDGWGMPWHIYYLQRAHDTGIWSSPQLATGQISASNGSIISRPGNNIFIASCGVSGNVYNGNVYVSSDTNGTFVTRLLASYISVSQPVLSDIIGEYGVLVFDAPIHGDGSNNIEIVYYGPDLNTAVGEDPLPSNTGVLQNYPNPFNAATTIQYDLPQSAAVKLEIFDITGRRIDEPVKDKQEAGRHMITWNAGDNPSGIYFYRIHAGEFTDTKRMLLLK